LATGLTLALGLAGTALAAEGAGQPLTLAAALAAAETGNPAYRRAVLAVDQADLALARIKADQSVKAGALALEQARGAVATARVGRDATRRKLRLDVRRAYYTLLTARRQEQVAREALALAEESRRIILGRRGPGASTQLDVLNAERVAAEAEAGSTRAVIGVHLAELSLADLLGWAAGTPLALEEKGAGEGVELPEEGAAAAQALEHSPEVRQTREALQAARVGLSLTENDYTPELTRKAAAERVDEAALTAVEAERRMALQARRALAEAQVAEAGVAAAGKAVTAAAEGFRAARVRLDAGLSVTDELLTAEVRLTQARQAELQARLDRDLARAALFSLIGE
jgi:outer membrane protein TolC